MNRHNEIEKEIQKELALLRTRAGGSDFLETRGQLLDLVERMDRLLAGVQRTRDTISSEIEGYLQTQDYLEQRITAIENSLIFRVLRATGRFVDINKKRLGRLLLRSPLHPMYLKFAQSEARQSVYQRWWKATESTMPSVGWHQERARRFARQPTISIVVPVHNPKREWLEAAVQSVVRQSYPHWQLCLCDDASEQQWVREYLADIARTDTRIQVVSSSTHLGISGALNRAGKMASGEYAGFLDHDDFLSPYALHYVAEALQDQAIDIVYTDEDQVFSNATPRRQNFKPDWSPDLLTGCMYLNHFLVVARPLLDRVGWFRAGYDGAQDYDLALRLTDEERKIHHVAKVLYHWRCHDDSTSADPKAKPYTQEAGRRALEDAARRRGWQAQVEDGPFPNTYHVQHRPQPMPTVSVIICSRNPKLLRRCLEAVHRTTTYPSLELMIAVHQTGDDSAIHKVIEEFGCQQVVHSGPFHFARMNNNAAAAASGDILLFLNDDVKPLEGGWLENMVGHLQRPGVGVVGAKLLYPAGTIQHAGMVLSISQGGAHPGRGAFASDYWNWFEFTREVSAVTGACLGIRKSLFQELGGFDLLFPVNFNDVDLCLRARQAGYRVIYEACAVLQHDECQTRSAGVRSEERRMFLTRWSDLLADGDPFYSPNLTQDEHAVPDFNLGGPNFRAPLDSPTHESLGSLKK